MEINAITSSALNASLLDSTKSASGTVNEVGKTFQELLNGLSETEKTSDTLMEQFAAGEDVELHDLLIAMEQTDINFQVAINVRDKMVSAYQEIMRMQV
jgi:flagellar hook-basal body complex protein FliE